MVVYLTTTTVIVTACHGVFCVVDGCFRKASARELQAHGSPQAMTARLMDAAGAPANVGLLQVQTGDGSFGSVCGMNLEAVDVVCRQLGIAYSSFVQL